MIRGTFRIGLPADLWIAEVSSSLPDATFELLSGVPEGDRALELGQVHAPDPGAAVDGVRSHPDVVAYDLLFRNERRALAHYEVVDQRLYDLAREFSVPPEFPVSVVDGRMEFSVRATRDGFEGIKATLAGSDRDHEIVSVLHDARPEELLTDRQRECLGLALRRGYYEIPRECTLADLADDLGVDPSTVSGVLRRAERRVLRRFVEDG
jgi:predicted DNA binding protein